MNFFSEHKIIISVIKKVGLKLFILNKTFQLVRKQKQPFNLHFTSQIIRAERIKFHRDINTLASFSASAGCYFQANNGIVLGKECLFGPGVKIISSNHNFKTRMIVPAKPIEIGDHVWLGANSIILPGVKIKSKCIIGAGSVVTKSFSKEGIVIAGNPAKILKQISL